MLFVAFGCFGMLLVAFFVLFNAFGCFLLRLAAFGFLLLLLRRFWGAMALVVGGVEHIFPMTHRYLEIFDPLRHEFGHGTYPEL